MPKRSVDWNETLAEKLNDLDFARDFLSDLIDEGDSLQEALGKTIRGYGVKEFCCLVDLTPATVQRAINLEYNPTKETLEKMLKPFGLTLGIKDIEDGAA